MLMSWALTTFLLREDLLEEALSQAPLLLQLCLQLLDLLPQKGSVVAFGEEVDTDLTAQGSGLVTREQNK